MRRPILYWMVPLLFASGCSGDRPIEGPVTSVAGEDHALEVERWRQDRHARLKQPDGWFSLVGLVWLEDGESACGSDPSSDVRLPETAPARAGVFRKSGASVEFEASPGASVKIDGQERTRSDLLTDVEGEPTVVEVGSIKMFLIDRYGRVGVRMKDSQSPALLAFEGLENFAIEPSWRVDARFVPYDPPKKIKVPTVLGTIAEQDSPGVVEFRVADDVHRLDVLPGDEEYFILFGDATNGKETYGAGRFLYADAADKSGRVVLDFNKAYNPPCAFTPYATCPLPPRQNRLQLAVLAGEKNYAGGGH